MKKTTFFCGAFLMGFTIFISCDKSSIESDAKKVAELQCKEQKLIQESSFGDVNLLEESKKISSEASVLAIEMQDKYTSDSDRKKFTEILKEEMKNCNFSVNSEIKKKSIKQEDTFKKTNTEHKLNVLTSNKNENNEIKVSEDLGGPEGDIVIAISDKVYFYENSELNSKTTNYFIKGQKAEYYEVSDDDIEDEFLYVNFTNKGKTISGYILKSDVKFK